MSVARQHCVVLVYAIWNIGRCQQFGWVPFVYGTYSPAGDFKLILTVKIETRHPVEGSFGSEFPVICNQTIV